MNSASFITSVLLILVGVAVWVRNGLRIARKQPMLPREPRAEIRWSPTVVVVAGAWVALHLAGAPAKSLTLETVQAGCVLSFTVIALFFFLLSEAGCRPLSEFGVTKQNWRRSIGIGVGGYLAAIPLVFLVLLLTEGLRSEETQHLLLQLIQNDSSGVTVCWVTLSVVVLAPISEELVFRVILQGALRSRLGAVPSIAISSVLFALVHGFPDMLALLPLAAVFGYVYEKTHSYLAVVVMHATFNAVMLAMTLMP